MEKMESIWVDAKTDISTVDINGNSITLKDVPALKNIQTNKVRVNPAEVVKAEVDMYAKEYKLIGRDVPTLLLLYSKADPFEQGKVYYKYHLNKMLFYLWQNLNEQCLVDAFPRDEFEAKRRGPVPENLGDDLKRLEAEGLVTLKYNQWGTGDKDASLITSLTKKGLEVADKLWWMIDDSIKQTILKTKEELFPLNPETIKIKVHKEFPQYRKIYTEPDMD